MPSLPIDTTPRLKALRALMKSQSHSTPTPPQTPIQAYIIPSEDQHSSEYLALHDERRAFISGFDGSAGCAVVTLAFKGGVGLDGGGNGALGGTLGGLGEGVDGGDTDGGAWLFTDGRYFLQAERQLDENWTLMRQGLPNIPTWQDFLTKHLPRHLPQNTSISIGIDPTLISWKDAAALSAALAAASSSSSTTNSTASSSPSNSITSATATTASSQNAPTTTATSRLIPLPLNLIDQIWLPTPTPANPTFPPRPPLPKSTITPLPVKYSGEGWEGKVGRVRVHVGNSVGATAGGGGGNGNGGSVGVDASGNGPTPTSTLNNTTGCGANGAGGTTTNGGNGGAGWKALIITSLDEIAWLFNLRGRDIGFNPVFFAYSIITPTRCILFVDEVQLGDEAREHLHLPLKGNSTSTSTSSGNTKDAIGNTKDATGTQNDAPPNVTVEIKPYEAFFPFLRDFAASSDDNGKILINDKTSWAVVEAVGASKTHLTRSPLTDLKSLKNPVEQQGFRDSHVRDGVALVRYFSWLEGVLAQGKEDVNEWDAGLVLERFREELDLYQGLSFPTISSTGPNGAIIHYSPEEQGSAVIRKDQIYLCDSGAQFLDGTTDVTRTWHFGTPTAEEKRAFTRVLQGHIAIDTAVFPVGTTGYIIDAFARRPLWQDGLDYRHGTGHGVGHFLCVHEGPHGIGVRIAYNDTPLKAGMTVSNEPGYYADGRFGIRIENVVLVREVKTPNNFGNKGYLGFEHVTMCPIHKNLIDTDLLTAEETKWLNAYHAEVLEKVMPLLKKTGDEAAVVWLEKECAPL